MSTYTKQCSQVGNFEYAKYFTLYVVLTDRDGKPETNNSAVDYKVYCQSSGAGSISANHDLYFWLDGKEIRRENVYVNVKSPNALIQIASGTLKDIPHENDGSRSISFSASINATGGYGVSASISDNFTLTTIPRASSISCTTANIGETAVVNINSASDKFTHSVWVHFGNEYVVLAENNKTGGTFTWDIPESFYAQIPNNKSGSGAMGCATYNGDKLIGEKYINITVTTNEEKCKPSLSATVVDADNRKKLIKHHSTAKVTIEANAKNSSSITSKKVNNVEVTGDTILLNNIETDTFVVTVTDSRGYTNTITLKPEIINYIPLSINATIKRTQPTTGEVDISFTGNYYNGNLGDIDNQLKIIWKYKENGTSDWIEGGNISSVIENNTFSNGDTAISLGDMFDYQKAYDFMLVVEDKLEILQPTYLVTQGIPIFNWGKDFVNFMGKVLVKNMDISDKIDGVVLYEDRNGATDIVFLSETAENFNCIEIYFSFVSSGVSYFNSIKVTNPNEKIVSLHAIKATENNYIEGVANATISSGSITINDNCTYYNQAGDIAVTRNEVHINKVIGYR